MLKYDSHDGFFNEKYETFRSIKTNIVDFGHLKIYHHTVLNEQSKLPNDEDNADKNRGSAFDHFS